MTGESRAIAILFSKDRPLQADGALRSLQYHLAASDDVAVSVVFRATSPRILAHYQRLAETHTAVRFIEESSFESDVRALLEKTKYVMFLVDDTLFVRPFSTSLVLRLLESRPKAIGFSLRLGKNTKHCYALSRAQSVPELMRAEGNAFYYQWPKAEGDFGYPMDVSSSVFRAHHVLELLEGQTFRNPNELEATLARRSSALSNRLPELLCHARSVAFSLPLNKVQEVFDNRAGNSVEYSSDALLERWEGGYRIRVEAYSSFIPSGCHEEAPLVLEREGDEQKAPRVSVIVPCFKQARVLTEALESVVRQTYEDWELIVVDDGSPDDAAGVARAFAEAHPERRIRVIRHSNRGVSETRNVGVRASLGRYILPLDADDKIDPRFLSETVARLDESKEIDIAYCDIQHFGLQHDTWTTGPFTAEAMVRDNRMPCGSLYRRAVFDRAGGYDPGLGYEDWDLWLSAIENGARAAKVRAPLFLYRKSPVSTLTEENKKRAQLIDALRKKHELLFASNESGADASIRVLLVCPFFPPSIGGVEAIAGSVALRLKEEGYRVDVLTGRLPERKSSDWNGVRIIEHSGHPTEGKKWPRYTREVRKRIESGDYAACVVWADPENWTWWSLEGIRVPKHTRVVVQPLINADAYGRWSEQPFHAERARAVISNPAIDVVTCTRSAIDAHFCVRAGKPPLYIPNAVAQTSALRSDAFRARFDIPRDAFLAVSVANLWAVKNQDGLLDALRSMSGDMRLVLIGHPSHDAAYVNRVKEKVAEDPRVMWVGGLAPAEVSDALDAADVVVLASHGEVSPVVLLEAMAHGRPWLATPTCGAAREHAGGVVAPLDEFPRLLEALHDNEPLRKKLGAAGQSHVARSYNWEDVGRAWTEVVQRQTPATSWSAPEEAWAATIECRRELRRAADAGSDIAMSFCLITHGKRRRELELAVASIHAQGLDRYEILVAGHVPFPLDRAKIFPMADDARTGRTGAMRGALVAAAQHEVTVLLDDDVLLWQGFASAAWRGTRQFGMLAVRLLNPDGSRHWDWATRDASGAKHRLLDYGETSSDIYVTGGASVLRSEVAKKVGYSGVLGFYEGEDVDFSRRVAAGGYGVGFSADAVATHMDPRYTQDGDTTVRFTDLTLKQAAHLCRRLIAREDYVRALNVVRQWALHHTSTEGSLLLRLHGAAIRREKGLELASKLLFRLARAS